MPSLRTERTSQRRKYREALEYIASIPKQGEVDDDAEHPQDWTDLGIERPVETLHLIIERAREALR